MDQNQYLDQNIRQIDEITINVVNIGIIVLDQEQSIIQWNHWMEKHSGLGKNEVIGKSLKTVFPEMESLRFFSAISQAVKKGSASVLAQSIHHSPIPLFYENKLRVDQAIEIQALKIISQKKFHCLIQVTDVGSAVRREDQLRKHALDLSLLVNELSESESMQNAIIAISGDGMIKISEDGLIECLSPRTEEIFGCKREDVIGLNVGQFLSTAYAEQAPSFIKRLTRYAGLMPLGKWQILEAIRQDGEIFPININLTTVQIAGKKQIVGIIRDLSELEESERALQASNDYLEFALESGEMWMWNWKIDTGEIHLDSMMKMLGYDKGQFSSDVFDESLWREFIHIDDWSEVNFKMQQHLAGESPDFYCEYRLRKASGGWMWVHNKGKVISRDSEGKALVVVGINQNITHRKLAEIEVKRATDKAIDAARVKSEFLGNMSHELRTPLNGIMGVLNLLKVFDPTKDQLEYINVAKRSAESLLKMIDNVLEFSKLGAKSTQLELINFDPEEIVKDVVKLLSGSADKKSISLNYSMEESTLKTVTTDPARLRQILNNLVGNALKFTHQGHVQIRILKNDNEHVQFEIEDTGIGIPEDRQDIIFDAFTQADVSTTREYGGTGLGLGISKELVELMGGQIMVESKPGKGSIFSFTVKDYFHRQLTTLEHESYDKELA